MTLHVQLTPEILVPRLGDYLVEKKLVSGEQLEKALSMQNQLKSTGRNVLLGELLVDMHFIDRNDLNRSITEQIVQLRNALQDANRTLEQRVIQRTIELQDALNKLSELDKLKSNIIANISHELRTPLTHIKGYQELLLAGAMGDLNPDQESTLKTIRRSTERLEHLIEDLINFSQISKGEINLKIIRLEMPRIVQNVIKNSSLKAEEKKIKLVAAQDPTVNAVAGDEEKVSWVIMQLIDNAIKFTPENGTVGVYLKNLPQGVLIAVQDTGIGIPADKINEIFEPFHQLDGSSTRRYGGTGLGLSLVRQIIQAHKTTIQVSSEPGKFSRFEFILPSYTTTQPLTPHD
jgi:two-component system, sensor histidine kinase and response regulator